MAEKPTSSSGPLKIKLRFNSAPNSSVSSSSALTPSNQSRRTPSFSSDSSSSLQPEAESGNEEDNEHESEHKQKPEHGSESKKESPVQPVEAPESEPKDQSDGQHSSEKPQKRRDRNVEKTSKRKRKKSMDFTSSPSASPEQVNQQSRQHHLAHDRHPSFSSASSIVPDQPAGLGSNLYAHHSESHPLGHHSQASHGTMPQPTDSAYSQQNPIQSAQHPFQQSPLPSISTQLFPSNHSDRSSSSATAPYTSVGGTHPPGTTSAYQYYSPVASLTQVPPTGNSDDNSAQPQSPYVQQQYQTPGLLDKVAPAQIPLSTASETQPHPHHPLQSEASLSRRASVDSAAESEGPKESTEVPDVPDVVTEGLSGRALVEKKRRWRKQEGVPGPGKNWRKGKGKASRRGTPVGSDHQPSLSLGSSPPPTDSRFNSPLPNRSGYNSPSTYPFTHHPQPFQNPYSKPPPILPSLSTISSANAVTTAVNQSAVATVVEPYFPNQMNLYKKGFHLVTSAPAPKVSAGYVVAEPLMNKGKGKELKVRKWKIGFRSVRSITGKGWLAGGGWMGEQTSELSTYLAEERRVAAEEAVAVSAAADASSRPEESADPNLLPSTADLLPAASASKRSKKLSKLTDDSALPANSDRELSVPVSVATTSAMVEQGPTTPLEVPGGSRSGSVSASGQTPGGSEEPR
ncbi:hypothetical protein [Phaffia rhodozyma]|uniref:Uncharacterized protein n=1 Tax=Phaffia rhodozyma TaxID=264483 RepID=A0A0F7SYA6_PHARH|nr:hypothetical protein [Phaffia rhodozyma]